MKMRHFAIKGLSAFVAIAALSTTASAAPLVVTFDPTGAGLGSGIAPFQSDTQNGLDAARAVIDNTTGNFVENGILRYDIFNNGVNIVPNTGLHTSYNLYLSFTGTGVLPGFNAADPRGATGFFTSVTYRLIGDPGANDVLTPAATGVDPRLNGVAPPGLPPGDILLATGGVGPTSVGINSFGVPTASAVLSLTQAATDFFLAPLNVNQFQASFTNSPGTFAINNLGTSTEVVITGSFNSNYAAVPEPAPLAVMGIAILGLAGVIRRNRKSEA